MTNNPTIFYTASFILVIFVLSTIFAKNIIYSLISSIMVFFAAAIFFYMLGSEYNTIIQAAIYGFAVPIIIALAIMFTSKQTEYKRVSFFQILILIFSVVFILLFSDIIVLSLNKLSQVFHLVNIVSVNHYDVLSSFAKGIYINYVWSFEQLSLLLTIIIAGFTLFKRKGGKQ